MSDLAQELLDKFSDPSHPYNNRLHEIAGLIEELEEEVDAFQSSEAYRRLERKCDELKAENLTLREALEALAQ